MIFTRPLGDIESIIVHCSATHPGMDVGVEEIRDWHMKRGLDDIGYHYVIRRSGAIEKGRELHFVGAHAKGHNARSVGICLVGGVDVDGNPDSNFTIKQFKQLIELVGSLQAELGSHLKIIGHREVSHKACPCFDVHSL